MACPHVHPHEVQAEGVRLPEDAFIAGFRTATDPASFLRLTAVPQALEQGGDRCICSSTAGPRAFASLRGQR